MQGSEILIFYLSLKKPALKIKTMEVIFYGPKVEAAMPFFEKFLSFLRLSLQLVESLLEREKRAFPHNPIHVEKPPTPAWVHFSLTRSSSSGGLLEGPGGGGWGCPSISPDRLEGIHRIHLLGVRLQRERGGCLQRGNCLSNLQRHSCRPSAERHNRICFVLFNHWWV